MPQTLAKTFPHLVHVEWTSLALPRLPQQLYKSHYNITNNYLVHLYNKDKNHVPQNEEQLKTYNCTVGVAMNNVLYDKPLQ